MTKATTTPTATDQSINCDELRQEIIAMMRTVYDPELPVNIYDLGLIYRIDVSELGDVYIEMTLTTPMCPEAQSLPATVQQAVEQIERVKSVKLELVWDPPWSKDLLSEEVKMLLGIF